jgi:hypothetical protein
VHNFGLPIVARINVNGTVPEKTPRDQTRGAQLSFVEFYVMLPLTRQRFHIIQLLGVYARKQGVDSV